MALHPDVQLRAQAEIDEKLGTGSLPSLKQLDNLHYLNAILKEVLRFAPVGPLGMCQRELPSNTSDDNFFSPSA